MAMYEIVLITTKLSNPVAHDYGAYFSSLDSAIEHFDRWRLEPTTWRMQLLEHTLDDEDSTKLLRDFIGRAEQPAQPMEYNSILMGVEPDRSAF
jgi:hypothetical protein